MGVLSRITAGVSALLNVARSAGGWAPIIREPYTGAWQNNDPLTPAIAWGTPDVFSVVSRITQDISKIAPPLLLEKDGNDFWTETKNSAYDPVLRQPNHYQTPQQFHEQTASSLLLYGNAYWLKQRDDRGVVNRLDVLDSCHVKVLVAPDGGVYYELQANELAGLPATTEPVVAPAREIVHLRWNTFGHPLVGLSPLAALAGVVNQAQAIQSSSTAFFAGGGRTPFALVAPTALDPASADRLDAVAQKFRTKGTMVLERGVEVKPLSSSAVDMQLIAQLGWTQRKICEAYGVPISRIDSSQQPPYANAEASQLQYVQNALETPLAIIEAGWKEALGLPTSLKIEFDYTLLAWLDTPTRTQMAKDAIVSGMSPNEVRETCWDRPPVKGGELPFLQQQNWPLSSLADREPPTGPSAPPPAGQPTEEAVAAAVGDLAQP